MSLFFALKKELWYNKFIGAVIKVVFCGLQNKKLACEEIDGCIKMPLQTFLFIGVIN